VQSSVVTLSGRGPVFERLGQLGVDVSSLGHGVSSPIAFARLARMIGSRRYDVVCAYGFKASTVARFSTSGLSPRTRFVCGVRGLHVTDVEQLDGPKARGVLALERLSSPLVDIYDSNSHGALALLERAGVPRRKLRFIPNGLALEDWPAAALSDVGEPVILCVARFVPRKRQIDLVRAAAHLSAGGESFRLVFVGDGPTLPHVKAAARASAASDQIQFRGPLGIEAVREALVTTDICCLCSLWEGMANSVMEAMACGIPVVGTSVNGITDLVVEGQTGVLVAPEHPGALADALRALLNDVALRRRLGRTGRDRVRDQFTIDAMVAQKAALYRELQQSGR